MTGLGAFEHINSWRRSIRPSGGRFHCLVETMALNWNDMLVVGGLCLLVVLLIARLLIRD
jgi:hypothetical protein